MLVMTAASCDVTDLHPVNVLSEDAAFATAANVELSVVGLYDAAQSGFYEGSEVNDRRSRQTIPVKTTGKDEASGHRQENRDNVTDRHQRIGKTGGYSARSDSAQDDQVEYRFRRGVTVAQNRDEGPYDT